MLFSAKSTTWHGTNPGTAGSGTKWKDNPAYVPFGLYKEGGELNDPFRDDSIDPYGFTRWLSPATFKRSTLFIGENPIVGGVPWPHPFKVWLGEDGPTPDARTDIPTKKKLIHHFVGTAVGNPSGDPTYRKMIYDGPDIQMFSGHSYGYIFELDEPVPPLPTTNDFKDAPVFTWSTVIYYGAAGE